MQVKLLEKVDCPLVRWCHGIPNKQIYQEIWMVSTDSWRNEVNNCISKFRKTFFRLVSMVVFLSWNIKARNTFPGLGYTVPSEGRINRSAFTVWRLINASEMEKKNQMHFGFANQMQCNAKQIHWILMRPMPEARRAECIEQVSNSEQVLWFVAFLEHK